GGGGGAAVYRRTARGGASPAEKLQLLEPGAAAAVPAPQPGTGDKPSGPPVFSRRVFLLDQNDKAYVILIEDSPTQSHGVEIDKKHVQGVIAGWALPAPPAAPASP